jgi:hypothetical protein
VSERISGPFWFPCEDPTADHKSDHGTSTTVKFFLKKEILGNGIHKPVDDAQIRGGYRYLTKAWGWGRPPLGVTSCNLVLGYPENPAQHWRENPAEINAARSSILLSRNQLISV